MHPIDPPADPVSEHRWKRRDAGSYDPVVESFDRLSDRYTAPIARRLASLAVPGDPRRLLDIATGTGVVAFALAAPGRRVVGVDLGSAMLARARRKAERSRVPGVGFLPMDAEALGLGDRTFDAATSLFGLLHFPHPERALSEIHRVLRPGGRLVVAVGSGPPRLTAAGMVDAVQRLWARAEERLGLRLEAPRHLDRLTAEMLPATAEPEEAPLARKHRNRAGVLPGLLRAAGFEGVRRGFWGETATVEGGDEFWQLQATFSSRARKRIEAADPDAVTALRRRFDHEVAAVLARGGRLVYPRGVLWVSGRRGGGGER